MRSVLIFVLAATADAQWGRKKQAEPQMEQQAPPNDVDRAMKGWEELAKHPEKMKEVMASFKDPEVVAKAQEMINDPVYMAAAKKKMAELQAKARSHGLLDEDNMPMPGAADAAASNAGMASLAAMMQGAQAAKAEAAAGGARDYEMENLARHRAGELNDAELGMANLKNAMKDPSAIAQMAQMLKDPSAMAKLKQMMADPTFQQQAQRVAQQMQADGSMPDFGAMAQQMGAMGAGTGGGVDAEIARLRRENAALKNAMA